MGSLDQALIVGDDVGFTIECRAVGEEDQR
jgi:hypothetical protein